MSRRNIWITFEDWSQLRKELGIKREKDTWGKKRERDEYWWFHLYDNEIEEWENSIEEYGEYAKTKCFERIGLSHNMLQSVKTPGIYNRLLKSYYRGGDSGTMFPTESYHRDDDDIEWIIRNFIAWAMNNVEDIDEDMTMEEWKRINSIMNKKMNLSNKQKFWYEELVKLFKEVRPHVTAQKVSTLP